ncbi:MAG: hypothetical protein IPK70_05070 [Flavobacteriales bacterium]|nr:hypothetical protein [Flavobacteriales bacterium]
MNVLPARAPSTAHLPAARIGLMALLVLLATGCARIPVQSVTLAEALRAEGRRMHQMNAQLVSDLFQEKQKAADAFIYGEYLPTYVENFAAKMNDADVNKANLKAIVEALLPELIARRDNIQRALEAQRIKVLEDLDASYAVYDEASADLRALLHSAVKVNEARSGLVEKAVGLSGARLDLDKLGTTLDAFIARAAKGTESVQGLINALDTDVNTIVNP